MAKLMVYDAGTIAHHRQLDLLLLHCLIDDCVVIKQE